MYTKEIGGINNLVIPYLLDNLYRIKNIKGCDINGYFIRFYIFSIIGYVGELIYCSLNKRKSGKALYGPWCPLYGLGGLLITSVLSSFESNILLVYIVGVIVSSFTEYFVSLVLEVIFDARWWDYSFKKFNLNGRICLENSLLLECLQ